MGFLRSMSSLMNAAAWIPLIIILSKVAPCTVLQDAHLTLPSIHKYIIVTELSVMTRCDADYSTNQRQETPGKMTVRCSFYVMLQTLAGGRPMYMHNLKVSQSSEEFSKLPPKI